MGLLIDGLRVAEMATRAARSNGQAQQQAPCPPAEPPPNPLEDVIRGPGRIVPGEQEEAGHEPGDLKYVLDETAAFVEDHVAADQAKTDAMVLYAAATHALTAFPTFGRMLFSSEHEASGKTMAMLVTASLSANPLDASGTSYALTSALAAAGNTPDQPAPALYYDEISSVFGRSGLAASRNPIADILRKGYKAGATSQWSVNRVNDKFSIFTPFLMTGLRVAVPRDIRSRCIPIVMEPGTPRRYFDARTAEPEAEALSACLAQAAGKRLADIAAFRARGIHPKLKDRKLEVWEGMFAVAYVLGGQEWLNRCLAAFKALSLAESDQVVLTPRQEAIRDIARVTADCDRKYVLGGGQALMGGLVLIDELKRVDNPRYQGRTDASLGQLISDALPMSTVQVTTVEGKRVRGYYADDIRLAWEQIRPEDPDDAEIPEEVNPFETDDEQAPHEVPPSSFPSTAQGSEAPHGVHDLHEAPSRPTALVGGYRAALLAIPGHDELDALARRC